VIANAAPGPASKIVVNAPAAAKTVSAEPKIVPVGSLSRRPGAPGLDAELERNYPREARRAGISGTAKLRVRIHADGRVGRVEQVSESHPGFGDACARTVRAARWEPPLDRDGQAVATEIVYVCKFEVRS
jgi:periplasmic protein TonB